jgi:hypothetical protein
MSQVDDEGQTLQDSQIVSSAVGFIVPARWALWWPVG